MNLPLPPLIKQVNDALAGLPGFILSLALTIVSGLGLLIAWYGPPALRAAVLAYFVMP